MPSSKCLILPLLALACASCQLLDTPPPADSTNLLYPYVYIEHDFNQDYVEVYADDRLIFADTVTTPPDGLATRNTFAINAGMHRFRVRLNGLLEADSTFETTGVQVVAVRYGTYDFQRHVDIPLTLQILPLDYIPVYD